MIQLFESALLVEGIYFLGYTFTDTLLTGKFLHRQARQIKVYLLQGKYSIGIRPDLKGFSSCSSIS
jgi:hypothetical protein